MSLPMKHKRQRDAKIPTKVVVRRLPPNFTSTVFKEQVSPIPEYNYFYFVNADRADGVNSFCRVYINFVHPEDILIFKEKYDNYVFLGPKGVEYLAVVEFAPFQKVPRDRFFQKRDVKCGSIHNNEYYLQFVNNLQLTRCEKINRPEYDLQLRIPLNEPDGITPLVKYVSARKMEQIKGCAERRDAKQRSEAYSMVFVNSSVRKTGNRRTNLKRHSP